MVEILETRYGGPSLSNYFWFLISKCSSTYSPGKPFVLSQVIISLSYSIIRWAKHPSSISSGHER